MDILFLIKNSHEQLKSLSQNLLKASHQDKENFELARKKWLNNVSEFLNVQQEFLMPELSVLLSNSTKQLAYQEKFQAKLIEMQAAFGENSPKTDLDEMLSVLDFVLVNQMDELMPRMRDQIPTGEREELGQAYQEYIEEFWPTSDQRVVAGG